MFEFLHVPVQVCWYKYEVLLLCTAVLPHLASPFPSPQSGSNVVLDAMKREYTREEFERVADYMTKHVPGMTLATVLRRVGFRGTHDPSHPYLWLGDRMSSVASLARQRQSLKRR